MQATFNADPKFYKDDIFDKIEALGERIEKWFLGFKNRRDIDKIHKALQKDPKLLLDTKEKFEKAFGVDTASRTPKQWQNLIRVYGLKQVCTTEKMTPEQVANKSTETFSQKVRSIR